MIINKILAKRKIGLALGGGAALGAAHIGVLKAIDELGIKISFISGNSIGAFVAALYAFGISWQEMEEIATKMHWFDISKLSLSKYSLLSNKKLGKIISDKIGDVEFDQAKIPLAIVAGNLNTGNKVVFDKGKVVDAVMASTAIPGVFKPMIINDEFLVDGGVVENVPVSLLKPLGAKYTIAVNLSAKRSFQKPENIVDVLINSFYTLVLNLSKAVTEDADLVILPDVANFSLVDTKNAAKLIEKGYEEAINVLSAV
jgi:NTE family protein